jgi:hypothetical protein
MNNAGFTYRLDRLKHRASKLRGPPAKVYICFNTVIGLYAKTGTHSGAPDGLTVPSTHVTHMVYMG